MTTTESELIAASRQGDQTAFAALTHANRHIAWTVCREITGHDQDAEDALQDALTAAWQNIDKFRGDSRFSTWLYRIASNAALAVRRRRRDTTTLDSDEIHELEDTAPPTAERAVTVDAVRRAIADLPEEFRIVIVLREFCDLTYADIADHQGIPVQTVKTQIHRARKHLVTTLSKT